MNVTVNGKPHEIADEASLSDLLAALELDPRAVVVERNREIVRRQVLDETALHDGDTIELVHFVGGG